MSPDEDKKTQNKDARSTQVAKGAERRAYERYPVQLQSRVNSQGADARDCIVRDFCVGGIYLSFESEEEDSNVTQLCSPAKGDEVSVECSVPVTGRVSTLSFSAQVVRKKGNGLALRFLNPDLGALQILLDHAKSLRKKTDGKNLNAQSEVSLSSEMFKGNSAAQIIKHCNQAVISAASSQLSRFHEDVADYLFEASKAALDVIEQNAYFEALKILNNDKDTMRKNFLASVEIQLNNYSPTIPQFVEVDDNPATISSLSIVDDEVFDDWLADTATVDSVESRNTEVLAEMEKRLSLLYEAEIKRTNNPYGPALFSRLFHDVLKPLSLCHTVNLACYKVFRNVLLESLDSLYGKINQYFIDSDVMPVIRYTRSQEKTGEEKPVGNKESEIEGADSTEVQPIQDVNENSQTFKSKSHATTGSGHDLYQLVGELKTLQQKLSHQVSDKTTGDLEAGKVSTEQFFTNPDEDAGVAEQKAKKNFSREEVQAALALVEPAQNTTVSKGEEHDFKSEVMKVLNKRAGDDDKSIGVREGRIIDVASNIFHWMSSDMQVSERMRSWISKLELPAIKIAVEDDTLFTDRTHLVRQVINKVAQLEMLVDESEKQDQPAVKKALDWIVSLVNEEFDGSTDVFARAMHQLDVLLNVQDKAYNTNLQQLVKTSQTEETQLLNTGDDSVLAPNVSWDEVSSEEQEMWIKRADRLQEGDWVVFDVSSAKPKRLRIAWKAIKTHRVVFANVLGAKDLILHLAELAKNLHDGTAMALKDVNEPAMDRAQYSMLQNLHQQLLHQSTHDQLTGLISRREFEKRLDEALLSSKEKKSRHAVCFIDLDQFNVINTACGYEGGDQLLKEVSELLSEQIVEGWVVARLGSDEFGLLLKDCALDDALDFVEELTEVIQEYRLQWKTKRLSIGFSMGLVPISHRSEAGSELLQAAESSCGIAKEMGGNRIQLYNASHAGLSQRQKTMKWAAEIDRILDEDTLYLRCQRIIPIDASNGAKDHYEILLGVWDLNGGEISTPEFIEAAERYKRMPDVDRWVIKTAFRWITENHQSLDDRVDMFSLNLSGRSLNDESFLAFLLEQIHRSKVPVHKITFEVTETAGVANISDAIEFIKTVKATGCFFSLDDFGTGMSSYAYLKNLPVDYLKIDGEFVKDMVNNPSDYAVAKSICEIGHFMGKKVIAEFVESDEILSMLKELGVDYAQGYGIEKPHILSDLVTD